MKEEKTIKQINNFKSEINGTEEKKEEIVDLKRN